MSFIKDLVKASGNEYAGIVSDGVAAGDVDSFIDSGSYVFNALLSGSLYGGLPKNKITAIAGESATGKTYFALGMCKQFLEDNNIDLVVHGFSNKNDFEKQKHHYQDIIDLGIFRYIEYHKDESTTNIINKCKLINFSSKII